MGQIFVIGWFFGSLLSAAAPASAPASRPASAPASSPSSQAADTPQKAHHLYWTGHYAEARQAYERLLVTMGPASQPAAEAFQKADETRKNEVAACLVGLSEEEYQTGEYGAALERLAVLGKAMETLKLPLELYRRFVEVQVRTLLAVGKDQEVLEAAKKALQAREDYAFRYLLGMVYDELNRPQDVLETLQPVFDEFKHRAPKTIEERLWAGQGLYLFCRTRGTLSKRLIEPILQDYFQTAVEGNPRTGAVGDRELWPALSASAEMLYLHYQKELAVQDAKSALKINPNLPQAYSLLARIELEDWGFEKAEKALQKALTINPHDADALVVLAQCRMLERKFEEAIKEADKALAVNPRQVEALALKVAALKRQFKDQAAEEMLKQVEAVWPNDPRVYSIIAEALSGGRQFAAAEEYFRKAIQLAPRWADPLTGLGMMFMQTGEDKKARELLEASNKIDSYNTRTFNTLNLLDYLQGRTSGADGKLVSRESKHFIVRYDSVKDVILGDYFLDYLEKIYKDVCSSYDFEPSDKTIIEVYPSQQKFAVRITGEPWIPTVGASTGRVIALTAPRQSAGAAPYNWTSVLKHEFTHTVTLAVTRNRIPHWFTEGLAVMTEDHAREWDWCLLLAKSLRRGELFTLENIDWGFARPKKPTSRMLAYAQSEWMCEYVVERWGYESINQMLRLYRDGKTQAEVFQEVCGESETQFSRDFAEWGAKEIKSWGLNPAPVEPVAPLRGQLLLNPDNPALLGRLAQAYLDAGEADQALETAQKLLHLKPPPGKEEPKALKVATQALLTKEAIKALAIRVKNNQIALAKQHDEDDSKLERELKGLQQEQKQLEADGLRMAERLEKADPQCPVGPHTLAESRLRDHEYEAAEPELIRYQQLVPRDPFSYRALAGIYLERNQANLALPQLIKLSQADLHDARLPRKVAALYDEAGKLDSAIEWQRRSIQIDPYDAEAHYTLGQWLESRQESKEALREYRVAAVLDPKQASYQEAAARMKESPASQP